MSDIKIEDYAYMPMVDVSWIRKEIEALKVIERDRTDEINRLQRAVVNLMAETTKMKEYYGGKVGLHGKELQIIKERLDKLSAVDKGDDKLKPCPFCGGVAKVVFTAHTSKIVCTCCGCSSIEKLTYEDTLHVWNRRV